MRFRDLLDLPHDDAGNIDMGVLLNHLPATPHDVAQQFFADHGRNSNFQKQYGHLDIAGLVWEETHALATALVASNHFEAFSSRVNALERRGLKVPQKGWPCIDTRPDVVASWRTSQTWLRPPIFMDGSVLEESTAFRLVEGHTRVGLLCGLVRAGVVDPNSKHVIWLGRYE